MRAPGRLGDAGAAAPGKGRPCGARRGAGQGGKTRADLAASRVREAGELAGAGRAGAALGGELRAPAALPAGVRVPGGEDGSEPHSHGAAAPRGSRGGRRGFVRGRLCRTPRARARRGQDGAAAAAAGGRARAPGSGGRNLLARGWGRRASERSAARGQGTWRGARRRPGGTEPAGSRLASHLPRTPGDPALQLRTGRRGRVPTIRPGLPSPAPSLGLRLRLCHVPSVSVCLLPPSLSLFPSSHPLGLALPGSVCLRLPLTAPFSFFPAPSGAPSPTLFRTPI